MLYEGIELKYNYERRKVRIIDKRTGKSVTMNFRILPIKVRFTVGRVSVEKMVRKEDIERFVRSFRMLTFFGAVPSVFLDGNKLIFKGKIRAVVNIVAKKDVYGRVFAGPLIIFQEFLFQLPS